MINAQEKTRKKKKDFPFHKNRFEYRVTMHASISGVSALDFALIDTSTEREEGVWLQCELIKALFFSLKQMQNSRVNNLYISFS